MRPTNLLPLALETIERGPVRWPGALPGWALLLLGIGLLLGVRWIYRRERDKVSRPWRIVLGGLRILAIVIVALTLFRPERELIRKVLDKSHLVLLVDTSQSMETRDRYRVEDEARLLAAAWPEGGDEARPSRLDASRAEIVSRLLAGPNEAVLRSLAERFVVDAFGFDQDLKGFGSTQPRPTEATAPLGAGGGDAPEGDPVKAIAEAIRRVESKGPRTDIGGALKSIAREFVNRDDRRLAGVILLSDGRDNAETERPADAILSLGKAAEELRVSAVALGDPRLAKNLRVDQITAPDVILKQEDLFLQAQLRQTGFDGLGGVGVSLKIYRIADERGRPLPARALYDPRPSPDLTKTTVTLEPEARPTSVRLQAPFSDAGTYEVEVHATLPKGRQEEDAIVEDDVMVHRLRVVDQTIRVLLVDREMRYETHFLKNVLVRERRRAGDPRRVDAQVWIQDFDPDVRQPSSGSLPPLRAFPSTRQEIFAYDVILLGEVAWRRLGDTVEKSNEILSILRDFVAEGGGLAFVAGEQDNPTSYIRTPLEDLIPVVLRDNDRANELPKTTAFRITPTEYGREHPILAVRKDAPEKVEALWREHPGWDWYWLYRSRGGLKPGATALATVWEPRTPEFLDDRGQPLVALAGMAYGKGRVLFSAIDQISRIRMGVADTYYGPFWDAAIRWLATYRLLGGNKRYKIETDKDAYFVGETATIKVSALDSDYRPLREPVLRGLQVEGPRGRPLLTEADAARPDPEGVPGVYRTSLRLDEKGTYHIYVDPPTRDGGARAERPIEARFATAEAQSHAPDHETLRTVVRMTNPAAQAPRLWAPWQLRELADSIPARSTERILDRKSYPVFDGAWPLLLVTAILALEWILRKRFQLI